MESKLGSVCVVAASLDTAAPGLGDLAPVPAMPFAARGVDAFAEDVEVGAGAGASAGGGGGFEFGALSPGELWASQDFDGEVDGGSVLGVDMSCVLTGEGVVGREAARACQWPASERGFVNGGNQCYMIAAVQLLGSVAEVRASLQRIPVDIRPVTPYVGPIRCGEHRPATKQ